MGTQVLYAVIYTTVIAMSNERATIFKISFLLKYNRFSHLDFLVAAEMMVLNNQYARTCFPIPYLYATFQLPAHTTVDCHKVHIYHLYTLPFISYNIVFHTTHRCNEHKTEHTLASLYFLYNINNINIQQVGN